MQENISFYKKRTRNFYSGLQCEHGRYLGLEWKILRVPVTDSTAMILGAAVTLATGSFALSVWWGPHTWPSLTLFTSLG